MTPADLPAVDMIAAEVHPDFPEDAAVFAERQRLYPDGTWLLEKNGAPAGYLLSHPWKTHALPPLNALLEQIPAPAETYYLHDLALLPSARGTGAAGEMVARIIAHAKDQRFTSVSLVAVNGSIPFWTRHGFALVDAPHLAEKLQSYERAARLMMRVF